MVPMVGLEPTRPHDHRILSAARIPFHHIGINKLESVMLRPIVDVKPFTSSLISNCLVMSEDNQSAPVSSHQILSGRQTPAVTPRRYAAFPISNSARTTTNSEQMFPPIA